MAKAQTIEGFCQNPAAFLNAVGRGKERGFTTKHGEFEIVPMSALDKGVAPFHLTGFSIDIKTGTAPSAQQLANQTGNIKEGFIIPISSANGQFAIRLKQTDQAPQPANAAEDFGRSIRTEKPTTEPTAQPQQISPQISPSNKAENAVQTLTRAIATARQTQNLIELKIAGAELETPAFVGSDEASIRAMKDVIELAHTMQTPAPIVEIIDYKSGSMTTMMKALKGAWDTVKDSEALVILQPEGGQRLAMTRNADLIKAYQLKI